MDRTLVLMKRGLATMFVPTEKVEAYLAAGWEEISRQVVPVPSRVPVAAETPAKPKPRSGRVKGE